MQIALPPHARANKGRAWPRVRRNVSRARGDVWHLCERAESFGACSRRVLVFWTLSRLLIVSNRLPVTVRVERNDVLVESSSGGLATAMRGPHTTMDSLWIGWPGDLSRLSAEQRARIDAQLAEQRTVAVTLSTQEVTRYYDGFSNSVLWPLFHYLMDKVHLDARRDWEVYRKVNQRFADAVAELYRPGDVIWIHDYQLALVPQLLRARLPNARIGFFLHIPFPSSEVFRLLPWREAILRGLLGADLIGFHTASYRHNFAFSAARVIGLDPEVDEIVYEDRVVRLGVHPIGIDAAAFAELADDESVRVEAREIHGPNDLSLALGVDRLDYTKGIPRRLLAVEQFLERQKDRASRFRYMQLAVPTRERVEAYGEFRRTVNELVGRINGHYGSLASAPIHFLHRAVTPSQLSAMYRAADVMVVTPLRDGMNLVAKEYVASRTDDTGVLILSEFAGAADELTDALLVNPYDIDSVAHALARATEMPREEQRKRMSALRRRVLDYDVHAWARDFLKALSGEKPARPATVRPGEDLVARLREAPRLSLFLDYDGTLVDIANRPDGAVPDQELQQLLIALSARPGTEVNVISERTPKDLDELLGELPVRLHAEHGFWSKTADGWKPRGDPESSWKLGVLTVLRAFAARTPGSFVEEKSTAASWHYRLSDLELASARVREIRLALVDELRAHDLELLAGTKVLEVRRRGVNKGTIVAAAPADALVVVAGDDRTDEEMFAAAERRGCSVHVGGGATSATFRLSSPAEVRRILRALLE